MPETQVSEILDCAIRKRDMQQIQIVVRPPQAQDFSIQDDIEKNQDDDCRHIGKATLHGGMIMKLTTVGRKVAGEDGFEPSNVGSKDRCLTTWRLPNAAPALTTLSK